MIYLDNAATTPVLPAVSQVMLETLNTTFGNPSSIHSYGRSAGKIIREARKTIATILDVPARNLIFTSGGSEANNQALIGYALANRAKGNHIITTTIEHHAVLHTVLYLQDRHGFDVTLVKPNPDGSWDQWVKLLDMENVKPSGSPIGILTEDDIEAAKIEIGRAHV